MSLVCRMNLKSSQNHINKQIRQYNNFRVFFCSDYDMTPILHRAAVQSKEKWETLITKRPSLIDRTEDILNNILFASF